MMMVYKEFLNISIRLDRGHSDGRGGYILSCSCRFSSQFITRCNALILIATICLPWILGMIQVYARLMQACDSNPSLHADPELCLLAILGVEGSHKRQSANISRICPPE